MFQLTPSKRIFRLSSSFLVVLVATFTLSCLVDINTAHAHGDSHTDQSTEEINTHGFDETHGEQFECEDLSEEVITSRGSFESEVTSLQIQTSLTLPLRPALETPKQFANPPDIELEAILRSRFMNVTQLPRSQLSD
jgi:ABC-type nickel/cobalt efflux system permease component RcnA